MVDLLNRSTGRLGVSSEALQRMIEERQRNPGGFLANLAQQARDEPLETASASGIPVVSDLADARLAGQSIGRAWRDPSKVNLLDASANVGMAALPFVGIGAIKAFHGSPHSFDKFNMSKIGTGEGAQAYGHGLYFAENEGVAKGYRDKLATTTKGFTRGSEDIHPTDVTKTLRRSIPYDEDKYGVKDIFAQELVNKTAENKGDLSRAVAQLRDDHRASSKQLSPEQVEDELRVLDRLARTYRESGYDYGSRERGALYDVNLDVNHEDLLDWDLPLSQQPPKVREALGKLGVEGDASGRDIYENMQNRATDSMSTEEFLAARARSPGSQGRAGASAMLREAGIPGIRYLDAGSRGGGEGSRNIVLFDDQLAEILGRR